MGVGCAWVVAAPWFADILGLRGLPIRLITDLVGEPAVRLDCMPGSEALPQHCA